MNLYIYGIWNTLSPGYPLCQAWSREEAGPGPEGDYAPLSKLPLPPLADTLAQLLDTARPILSDTLYQQADMSTVWGTRI